MTWCRLYRVFYTDCVTGTSQDAQVQVYVAIIAGQCAGLQKKLSLKKRPIAYKDGYNDGAEHVSLMIKLDMYMCKLGFYNFILLNLAPNFQD